ncbi:hypothetical protein ABK040_006606 [Willaertia magna]
MKRKQQEAISDKKIISDFNNKNNNARIKNSFHPIFEFEDILACILQFLTTTEYFQIIQFINKTCYQMVHEGKHAGLLFQHVYFYPITIRKEEEGTLHDGNLSIKKKKRIKFTNVKKDNCKYLKDKNNDTLIHKIIKDFNFSIKGFTLKDISYFSNDMFYNLLLKNCSKQLKIINIESKEITNIHLNCNELPNLKIGIFILKSPKFESFNLFSTVNSNDIKNSNELATNNENYFLNLEKLEIKIYSPYENCEIFQIEHENILQNLKILNIQFFDCIKNLSLYLPNLEECNLRMNNLFNIYGDKTDKFYTKNKCNKLTNLEKLSSCNIYQSDTIIYLKNCNFITKLHIPLSKLILPLQSSSVYPSILKLELDVVDFITEKSENGWITKFNNFPNLEHLKLYSSNNEGSFEKGITISKLDKLKTFQLELNNIKNIKLIYLNNLQNINIVCNDVVEYLIFSNCISLTTKSLNQTLQNLNFKNLKIKECNNLQQLFIPKSCLKYLRKFIVSNCNNLFHFHLSHKTNKPILEGMIENCKKLRVVEGIDFNPQNKQSNSEKNQLFFHSELLKLVFSNIPTKCQFK